MPLHSTKEKKGARSIHFNFVVQGQFRPVSSVSIASRYDPIWPVRPDSGRISPVWLKSKPSRCKSKGEKKKKKKLRRGTDAQETTSGRVKLRCRTLPAASVLSSYGLTQLQIFTPIPYFGIPNASCKHCTNFSFMYLVPNFPVYTLY